MHRIFGKVLSASELLNLGGPAGSSAPGKVLRPQNDESCIACRDGDAFFCRTAILYRTIPGQIERKVLGGYQENIFTKMMISRSPVVRFV